MNKFALGKYKGIVVAISVFIFLIAGVMGLNFLISTQLANDAVGINIAGRQRMVSQRLFKELLNLKRASESGGDVAAIAKQVQRTAILFDKTLNAFINGGQATGDDGREATLKPVTSEAGGRFLEEAEIIWAPFKQLLDDVSTKQLDSAWMAALAQTVDYGRRHNVKLLDLMNDLTVAFQSADDTVNVSLAVRQQMLSQRLVKEVLELQETAVEGEDINESLETLGATATLFDTVLTAFQDGGSATGADGTLVTISRAKSPESQEALAAATQIWRSYKRLLDTLLSDAIDTLWLGQIAESVAYGRENNLTLLILMNDLAAELERLTLKKVARLRFIQAAAIVVAFIFFFFIIFRFVRQLRQSDATAEKARQETENILNTVQEGLFLLDENFTIGSQFSTATKSIFDKEKLEDSTLQNLLGDVVTKRDMQLTEDYINLLFGDRVNENLIADINPLNQVEVNLEREGNFETKYLAFNFNRVWLGGNLSNLLVTVNDISDSVKLQQEVEDLKEKSQDQLNMLINILHVENKILTNFLNDTISALTNINEIFKQPQTNSTDQRRKVDTIFRVIHKLKGDAGALHLDSFESRAHEFEDMLTTLREQQVISGNDFLPLTIKLNEFITHHASVSSLVQRFNEINSSDDDTDADSSKGDQTNWSALDQLVQRVAADQGKQVELLTEGLDPHTIPNKYHKTVWEIAVQLVRNSVVHGIEAPYERLNAQKGETGNLKVSFTQQDTGYELAIRDDGRGIDTEKLRAKALENGTWGEEDLASWDRDRLLSLIFEPGFSTASEITKDAGRGVGMDVIKEVVEDVQGQMKMDTSPGQYFEFKVQFPE